MSNFKILNPKLCVKVGYCIRRQRLVKAKGCEKFPPLAGGDRSVKGEKSLKSEKGEWNFSF